MRQGEAVFVEVTNVLTGRGVTVDAETPVVLTKEERATVREQLVNGFMDGSIDMSDLSRAKYIDGDESLPNYVNGLITNWLKKDPRLNGGVKYAPKNPGSRAGQGDKQIVELKKMLQLVDEDKKPLVRAAIEKRLAEIQAEKAKNVEINVDLIPEHLREMLGE